MVDDISISVVVCAYNSQDAVPRLLAGLAGQASAPSEIIVVDSNSMDDTSAAVKKFAAYNPGCPVRLIHEKRSGKSHALNAGVMASSGEVIAFLDDDAMVERGWIAAIVSAFEHKNIDGVGGRILPEWNSSAPSWFTPAVAGFTPVHDFGNDPLAYDLPGSSPVGANMAFRRSALDKAGLFDTNLGHVGARKIGGEESDLCQRMHDLGLKIVYWPDAAIHHCFGPEAEARNYWRKRVFTQGRAAAYYLKKRERSLFSLAAGAPARILRQKNIKFAMHSEQPGKSFFYYELKLILHLGFIHGLWGGKNAL